MKPVINMVGQRSGALVVLREDGRCSQKEALWLCLCDCGNTVTVRGYALRQRRTRSCGCLRNKLSAERRTTHGESGGNTGNPTPRYRMWNSARTRAKKKELEFSINLSDVVIPSTCEVLGIELEESSTGRPQPNSPSLDRIDNSRGYSKDNIRVISYRANWLKNNATLEELEAIAKDVRKIEEGERYRKELEE